jgi:RNA polymerase sigma-70 factor (ECF subfamily)
VGPEELGRLLDSQAAALTLYARQWCSAAEDVVQEAFLKLARQQPAPENAVAWLYKVVRNGAITSARSARRRQRFEAAAASQTPAWFIADEDKLDADTATQALRGLPEEQRECIVAHLWGGLTFAQIAELLGSSASTVHRWYLAGLATLRERLGVACPNESTMGR